MSASLAVVIGNYALGGAGRRLLESLDRQSLEPTAFSVVFVHDGQDHAAWERLLELRSNRPNVLVERVDGASSPAERVATGLAATEADYVVLADGIAELRPEALDRLLRQARQDSADVLLAKSVSTNGRPIGSDLFRSSGGSVPIGRELLSAVGVPRTYRRQFLLDEDSELLGVPGRHLDTSLYLASLSRGAKVSVLAGYTTFVVDSARASEASQHLLVAADEPEVSGVVRRAARLAWYVSTLTRLLSDQGLRADPPRLESLEQASQTIAAVIPAELDGLLEGDLAELARLVRSGRHETAATFAAKGANQVRITGTRAHWDSGRYRLEARAQVRVLGIDTAEDAGALRVELLVKDLADGTEWTLTDGAETAVVVSPDGGVTITATASVDLASAAHGEPLADGEWIPLLRVSGHGSTVSRRLPLPAKPSGRAVVAGRGVVPFATKAKRIALDVGARQHPLVGRVDPSAATIRDDARGTLLRIALTDTHCGPGADLAGEVRLDRLPMIGRVVADGDGDGDGAVLETWVSGLCGSYPLWTKFCGGRLARTGLSLEFDHVGRASVQVLEPGSPAAPADTAVTRTAAPSSIIRRVLRRVPGARTARRRLARRGA